VSYRSLSLWHDTLPEGEPVPRVGLEGPADADVVIVGAGYTGLWTAYYLAEKQPDLRIVVLEAEVAGFGASGRNGGWCAGEIAGSRRRIAERHGRGAVTAIWREMFKTVDEVGRAIEAEAIDCGFVKSGILTFASIPAHVPRLQAQIEEEREWGFGEEDFRWLDQPEAEARLRAQGIGGAVFTPHAAAIHPARLARGLAEAVERHGVKLYEQTPVLLIRPGEAVTGAGTVSAPVVLRCTEAFTVDMPGERRRFVPVYSLMVATEPLSEATWDSIGLAGREVFNDARHLIIYGQRTEDGRFAFGGRGAPYHLGSTIRPEWERSPSTHQQVAASLRALFPQIGDAAITHEWGGAVAVPRDWRPTVRFDPLTGLGTAGGYVGEGVAAANLAGRTLSDLVLGRSTELTRLPWVGHRSRRWEIEPLRWTGVNLGRIVAGAADRAELRSGKPSKVMAGMLDTLLGR
jgi:glycine/D-amino acid oxidase-like deaminating enzyme